MYRVIAEPVCLGGTRQPLQEGEAIDLGLEALLEEGIGRAELRVHHHDVRADAPLAELAPLIGYCHSEVVHAVLLQRACQLDRPDAIAIGLDHADQGMPWGQEAALVIEVGDDGAEVDIQHRLMHVRREAAVEALEGKAPRALE